MRWLKQMLKGMLPARWTQRVQCHLGLPRRVQVLEKQLRILTEHLAQDRSPTLVPKTQFHAPINAHELKVFSQNGEDGILLYLFSKIGSVSNTFVEFGIGDGSECNTADLSINFGWRGLLMDCESRNVNAARRFYDDELRTASDRIQIIECMVTAENINDVLATNGFQGEIDLLSIDIDGNDYWVWKAIDVVNPRVVVCEYNACFGCDRAITVAYDPVFDRRAKHPSLLYFGASLPALTALAKTKGYVLAGCDQHGVNAFFVRQDLAEGCIQALTPAEAYYPLRDRLMGVIGPDHFQQIAAMPFDTV